MKKFVFVAAAALAVMACNDIEPAKQDSLVRLDPVITRALSLNFNSGDEIGVKITMDDDSSVYVENEKMTYDGSAFSSDLKWYADGGKTCTVTAWYPYLELGFPESFTVAQDQSLGTESSDFMMAVEKGVYPSSDAVLAKFRHQFSQINVVITSDFDVAVDDVTIKGVNPTAVFSTAEDGSVVATADPDAALVDIKAEEITAGKLYSVVLVPQDLAQFGLSVSVKQGSTILSGISNASLKPGYSYTITAVVTVDQVTASISGEILAWEDGGNLDAGDYEVPFEEFEDYFVYDGVRYNTVEIGGKRWMAAPLAYLPQGKAASDSPAAGAIAGGVFYPYSVVDGQAVAQTDAASVKAKGYLYSIQAALGVSDINADNFTTFEGVQGICPKGWHVPSRNEYVALCGYSIANKLVGETSPVTDTNAAWWDSAVNYGNVSKANESGFNFTFSGTIANFAYGKLVLSATNTTVEDYYGNPSLNYLWTSTGIANGTQTAPNCYFGAMMTTFTKAMYPLGRLTIAQLGYQVGAASVRCVKD